MEQPVDVAVDVAAVRSAFSSLTLAKVLPALAILAVGSVAAHLLLRLFQQALRRSHLEKGLLTFLHSLLRIVLYVVVMLIALGTLGMNVSSLVAMLSIASLAISLAVHGTLSNVAGGIQILTAHPFRVGDYVIIDDVEGTVREIGVMYTRLITRDNKSIYLPNSSVASKRISNCTIEGRRRVDLPISAAYSCPTEDVRRALIAAALAGGCLPEPAPEAFIRAYDDSAIRYELQFWSLPKDYWATSFAVTEAVREEFNKAGLIMTYPHLNVHLDRP